ncbi:MAG: hypothetical protein U5R48_02565 [Gammaproteobacteria bacterium]|nr:hypothetical protein [Gammaproteobacteria bacterium]
MDWNRYRELCDQGDVLSRWLLTGTADLLRRDGEASLADWLESHLEHEPLPKPEAHLGGAETDFFRVTPDLARVQRIVDHVARAAADPERRLPGDRGFGGVTEAWTEFRDWLDGSHPRSPYRPG